MSDGFTYVIKCASGKNKENCPYILQNAISACAACTGAVFVKRNREDYAWQYEKTEENTQETKENTQETEENQTN